MKPVFETGGLFRGSLLRITFFSGLLLLLLTGGAFLAVYRAGSGAAPRNAAAGFYRLLGDYDRERDTLSAGGTAPDHNAVRRTMETLDRDLDRLEKKAGGVEAWLSVLKRRRELARLDLRFAPAFRQSARRAALAYPYSEPLAAVAAAAVIHGGAITREGEAALRSYLPLLAGSRLERLRLGLHVLLGDFRTPRRAADSLPPDIPPQWVSPALWQTLPSPDAGAIAADLAIVKVLQGDIAAASTVIQEMLSGASTLAALPPPEIIRFAAEFSYDFSAPARSAELFSRLTGDVALSRQADALWLAGYSGSARTIWTMLAPSALSGAGETAAIGVRALYNLALTAETPKESAALLGRLPGLPGTADPPDPAGNRIALMGDLSRRCGLIRYSRFLDAPRAIALLEANKPEEAAPLPGGQPSPAPVLTEIPLSIRALTDLEILRRRTEIDETARLLAETWLLAGNYPEAEPLYRWGAWFFDLQRSYGETALLLKNAAHHGFTGQWMNLHEALGLIREGNLDRAESLLTSIPAASAEWASHANLGRILEARRIPAKALEHYETAAAQLAGAPVAASRVQVRIAQCLKTLGRVDESRRVLEYALDLNPENLNARLELHRLE